MMMNVVFCALPRNRAKQPETGIMKRCPPMLRQFCWNKSAFAGENRIGNPRGLELDQPEWRLKSENLPLYCFRTRRPPATSK